MSEVRLEIEAGVAVVTLAAPERKNALTPDMARELLRVLDQVDSDASIGAVVVRGDGGSFCSGAHLGTLSGAQSDPALGLAWEAVEDTEFEGRAVELARGVAADPALTRATVQSFRVETGPPSRPGRRR